jgi:hypothetical protein
VRYFHDHEQVADYAMRRLNEALGYTYGKQSINVTWPLPPWATARRGGHLNRSSLDAPAGRTGF